ncbi:MAG: hypothetical protein QNJ15_00970 [Erythrobacter sp.]|nr:hypothetical protein [Erythrobacter sp.]
MTDNAPTPAGKRDELRAKIEASERRIAERSVADQAKETAGAATTYVKENPFTVLGGAIALGLVVGMLTRPGRRAARNAATGAAGAVSGAATGAARSVGNAAKARGSAFGTLLADALVAYGIKLIDDALDSARTGREKLEDLSDDAAAKSREMRRDADYLAGTAADKTKTMARRTRRKAERAVRDLKDRVSN